MKVHHRLSISTHRKTKSEELLATLKSIGYIPPKQHKAEHYDFLFQDRKVSLFVQKLTNKINSKNVLGKDEMEKIEKLKESNLLVYGKKLESLVYKAASERLTKEAKSLERESQLNAIKQRIEEKKQNIEKLKSLQAAFSLNDEKRKGESSLMAYVADASDSEFEFLRQSLAVDSSDGETVAAKCIEEIECKVNQLRNPPPQAITVLLESGIEVENTVRQRMKLKLDCESDMLTQPLSPFEICKTFQQYGKDFERLKHVIIYEIIKQIQMKCKESCDSLISTKLSNFQKENERILRLSPDIQSKMISEKMESIDLLEKSVNAHVEKKMAQLRQNLVSKFDEDTREVQQKKYETRKQIQGYYEVFVDALIKQLINILASDYIVNSQTQHTLEFMNYLKGFCEKSNKLNVERKYLTSEVTEDNVTTENHKIVELFKCYGISLGILRSHKTTIHALTLIRVKEQQVLENECLKQDGLVVREIQDISQQAVGLRKKWCTSKEKFAKWNKDYEGIKKLEGIGHETKEKIKDHVKDKEKLVKESIKKKEDLLDKMRKSLDVHNLKEAKSKGNTSNRRSSMFDKTCDSSSFVM